MNVLPQLRWLEDLVQDLRFVPRILLKQPIAFIAAMAALALGIGLVTLMFCMINGLLLRGLPLPEGHRLVSTTLPAWAFNEIAERQTSFEGLVSFRAVRAKFKANGPTSRMSVCYATANLFDVLGVKPILGRGFYHDEDKPSAAPVALLSYKVWQEVYQGDASILGASIWVEGQSKTVVGVMPPQFHFPINESVWVASQELPESVRPGSGFVFGRLKPSVSVAGAGAELNALWSHLLPPRRVSEPPPEPIRVGPYVNAVTGELYGNNAIQMGSLAAMLATLLVLFLACANVALLTLGRAVKRGKEFAVRSTLGATRRRLVSQILAENLVLSVGGAIGGTVAAAWIKNWILSQMPADTSVYRGYASWWDFTLDGNVLLFVVGLTFLTNLIAGLWPALSATKRDANDLLKDQALGLTGLQVAGFQRCLIVSQVAVSVVILVGAVALLEQGRRLRDMRLTFNPRAVYLADVEVPDKEEPIPFFEELERHLGHVPGVETVALSSHGFAFGRGMTAIELPGQAYARAEDTPRVASRVVTAGFFATANLPLLQGRGFNTDDRIGSPDVAVVNATFTQRFLPPDRPLGSRFRHAGDGRELTVIGTVPDAVTYGAGRRHPVYYVPLRQHPRSRMRLVLRGDGKVPISIRPVLAEVGRFHLDAPLIAFTSVQQEFDRLGAGKRYERLLLSVCGAASLFLATLGIFGLISLSVNQRTREIGVHQALGATKANVVVTILRTASLQIGLGLGAGVLMAIGLVRALGSVLPDAITEPGVYVTVVLLLGTVSLAAVLIPARRACRIDPTEALRYE